MKTAALGWLFVLSPALALFPFAALVRVRAASGFILPMPPDEPLGPRKPTPSALARTVSTSKLASMPWAPGRPPQQPVP